MIPHISSSGRLDCLLAIHPARDVRLPATRNSERAWGNVFGNRRAGADVRALPDLHRRDQLRVAANECAVLDDGGVLTLAVVVTRNRAGANVHVGADGGVPEIREMVRLRSVPK